MSKTVKFKNTLFNKKELKNVIYTAFIDYGTARASYLADDLKELGFHYATKAGISISVEDLKSLKEQEEHEIKAKLASLYRKFTDQLMASIKHLGAP